MKKHAWLILCLITIIAGLALSLVNMVTEGPIAQQKLLASNASRIAVFPNATGFEAQTVEEGSKLDSVYAATKDGQTVGYVLQSTVTGYGGPIEIVMGIDNSGTITGISVGGSSFAETAGLGARTRDAEFTSQFVGLKAAPKLKENIDGISGATISSSAVTSGANRLYQYWQKLAGVADTSSAAVETLTAANQKTVTVKGFGGDIDVTVGINPDGTIEGVLIGGANFNETEGMGALALEKSFRDQFIGKSGPVSYGDGIDAISGATITSTAVLKAINEALGTETAATVAPAGGQMVTLDAPDADGAVKIYTETVQGFKNEIVVTVGLDANNAIASLKIGGPNFAETEYYGAQVKTNAFRNQFIGKTGVLTYGAGVDAVSGATISSNAVLSAINNALSYDSTAAVTTATQSASEVAAAPSVLDTPTVKKLDAADENGAVVICTETVQGFKGEIVVTVGLDANGTIVSLVIGGPNFAETEYYGAQAKTNTFRKQFIGKSGLLAYGNGIDAISGATITSTAVLKAVNGAISAGMAVLSGANAASATTVSATTASATTVKATSTPAPTSAVQVQTLSTPDGNGAVKICTETVRGFKGEIVVTIGLDANGTIVSLDIGGPNFHETEYYGAQAKTNAFRNQFIGKSGVLTYGNGVDAISGATITSNAVLKAINDCLQQ